MIIKSRAVISVISALFIGTSALAEEDGVLNLTIDGTTYAYPLWAGQSDWSGSEQFASISIYARPVDPETWAILKDFTLGMDVSGGVASLSQARLMTADGANLTRYYAQEDETPISVTVDEIAADDKFLTVSGTFSMTMGTSENFGRNIDMSASLEVAGDFAVTLEPIE